VNGTLAPVVSLSQRRRPGLPQSTRILVTGSRMWEWPGVVHRALDEAVRDIYGEIVVVHGRCDPRTVDGKIVPWRDAHLFTGVLLGADWHAHRHAERRGWISEGHEAQWRALGKSAGHVRNKEMVDLGADLCLGFPYGESPGTRGCLIKAVAARIPIRTYEG
jgi:hypothetical protein